MGKLFKNQKPLKAFTLIEVTVVIIILAIFTSLVFVWMQPSRAQGRDAKRVTEVNTLRTALQLYFMDKGQYPVSTENEDKWCSVEEGDNLCPNLASDLEPYLRQMPNDPLYGEEREPPESEILYSYQYISTSSGEGYKFYADLETRDPYEVSGGGYVISPPSPPICGNGTQDPGEACDDGNNNNNDSCPDGFGGSCQLAYCGDGFLWNEDGGFEECDPPGSGCGSDCMWIVVLPEVSFSSPPYSVNENGGSKIITVNISGLAPAGGASVQYDTSNGSAVAGACGFDDPNQDYESTSGILNWAEGESGSKTFTVTICDDSSYEANETINLALSNAVNANLGSPNTAVLTIVEDEPSCFISHEIYNPSGNPNISRLDVAYIDDDEDLDIATAESMIAGHPDYWYRNDTLPDDFTQIQLYPESEEPKAKAVAIVDFDNNGTMDIVEAGLKTIWCDNVDGDGTNWECHQIVGEVGQRTVAVEVIDFDGDDDMDVITGDRTADGAGARSNRWYENQGDNINFVSRSISGSNVTTDLHVIDFDKDGDYDIVESSMHDNITWYRRAGSSPPYIWTRIEIPSSGSFWSLAVGELDGDPKNEVIGGKGGGGNNANYWWDYTGGVSFTKKQIHSDSFETTDINIVDLDKDGNMDVVTADTDARNHWYRNNGSEVFTSNIIHVNSFKTNDVEAVDFDLDGSIDIVEGAQGSYDYLFWYENTCYY